MTEITFLFLLMLMKYLPGQETTKHPLVILYMIDGLHWEAPAKLNMPFLNLLIKEGTYIEKSYMIIPHHPTIGDYSKQNSCSFPNPMLHQGTIFINQENKMIQDCTAQKEQGEAERRTAEHAENAEEIGREDR